MTQRAGSSVFISYRRADSAEWARRLNKHIGLRFGRDLVFQDVDDIEPGVAYQEKIRSELRSAQAYLVLIGTRWLVDAQGRRRLEDPNDILRMEVMEAIDSQRTVIPVLVDEADMPKAEDLPDPLKSLVGMQGVQLRPRRWRSDMKALLEKLREIILPTAEQVSVRSAQQEVYDRQLEYFDLLEGGKAAEALERAQKAQAYLDRVLPLYPQDPELKVTRGYLFKNEAMALLRLERNDEATEALDAGETIFRTMLDERPRDAGAWNGLGSIEAVRGNAKKAHEFVDKALKILPDYPAARHDHGQILADPAAGRCRLTGRSAQAALAGPVGQCAPTSSGRPVGRDPEIIGS
jgi:tetratricopeptide (TPR) repeat protein